ncbi:RNA polymerase sigma factor (sigma-70 family) [Mycobacterium frederiksbergense]|uniref:RNA polymerase sigma factor n=1 Tax=Mycolicibacterium frederiksbergense TaxID=117567 RepID=A0ABT6L6X0_9MYCO|nr:RNA polymerase sigma factor (sigma-70 family) [Mycolicibacterium frederiksbergense]
MGGVAETPATPATSADMRTTLDAVWRMEAAKILATLTRTVGDVGLAEDLAQEALLDALAQWPASGVPRNPGAWLTTVAKRKAIDHWRRAENLDAKYAVLARDLAEHVDEAWDPDRIDDDVLRLIFIAAHPVLSREAQIALTLRVVGGLSTDEIARAFLISTPTAAARITRAKKALTQANAPFEVPPREEYPKRLSAVLSVVYLIYNEGYSASAGQRWIRDELCTEALRLGRALAALVPDEPEVHALVALMEFQSSRFAARRDAEGRPILLEDQNRARWDRAQIQRGVAFLQRANTARQQRGWGPYALQAALAECHATAPTAADTDWSRIVKLYDALLQVAPSPVVQLNRAVAVAMDSGPQDAMVIVDGIEGLDGSYLLPSVRGELLARLGRHLEAAEQFDRAADMTENERERDVLAGKAIRERDAI